MVPYYQARLGHWSRFFVYRNEPSPAKQPADPQNYRLPIGRGASHGFSGPADAEYFQALRSAVAQGLSPGTAMPEDQVLDRLEAKYASHVDAAKMIDAINVDNSHEEVSLGRPVGKEKL